VAFSPHPQWCLSSDLTTFLLRLVDVQFTSLIIILRVTVVLWFTKATNSRNDYSKTLQGVTAPIHHRSARISSNLRSGWLLHKKFLLLQSVTVIERAFIALRFFFSYFFLLAAALLPRGIGCSSSFPFSIPKLRFNL
jgi:hypothetical protein